MSRWVIYPLTLSSFIYNANLYWAIGDSTVINNIFVDLDIITYNHFCIFRLFFKQGF